MPLVGRLAALWRYPFKSMLGEALARAAVGPLGIYGDRGWALREADGRDASAKRHAALLSCSASYCAEPDADRNPPVSIALPDGRVLRSDHPTAALALSQFLGRPMTLDDSPGAHFDDAPIHLVTSASLAEMRRRCPGADFDARRFRPNLVVEGAPEGLPELSWVGRRLRVGGCEFSVRKPTKRCVMTTLPQEELPKDARVLQAVIDQSGAVLGVYLDVTLPGELSLHDPVELL